LCGQTWPTRWAAYRATEDAATLVLGETLRGDTLRKFILMFRAQHSRLKETVLGARVGSADQREERIRLVKLAEKRGVLELIETAGPICSEVQLLVLDDATPSRCKRQGC